MPAVWRGGRDWWGREVGVEDWEEESWWNRGWGEGEWEGAVAMMVKWGGGGGECVCKRRGLCCCG